MGELYCFLQLKPQSYGHDTEDEQDEEQNPLWYEKSENKRLKVRNRMKRERGNLFLHLLRCGSAVFRYPKSLG